jgi:hypothetical protein
LRLISVTESKLIHFYSKIEISLCFPTHYFINNFYFNFRSWSYLLNRLTKTYHVHHQNLVHLLHPYSRSTISFLLLFFHPLLLYYCFEFFHYSMSAHSFQKFFDFIFDAYYFHIKNRLEYSKISFFSKILNYLSWLKLIIFIKYYNWLSSLNLKWDDLIRRSES